MWPTAAAQVHAAQRLLPVVVVIEVDGLGDLRRHPVVQVHAGRVRHGPLVIGQHVGQGDVFIHALPLGDGADEVQHAQIDGAAGDEPVVPQDEHTDTGVTHVHQTVVPALRLGAADAVGEQRGVGRLLRQGQLQLEARAVHHAAVVLDGGFQGGAGEQLHPGDAVVLAANQLLHGVVKVVAALLLGQVVLELEGQVIRQLAFGHGGQLGDAGEYQRGRQDHCGLRAAWQVIFLGQLAQEIGHGVHGHDGAAPHQPIGHRCGDGGLADASGAPDQLDLGGTDIKRDDISGHRQYLTFRTDSDRRR